MQRVSHIAPPRAEFELWSSKGKSGPPSKCSSTIEALRLFRATSLYSSVSRDLLSRRNATTAKMTAMHPSMDVFPRLFTCACIHFCSQEMRHDCENDRAASTWMRASLNGRKHPVTTPLWPPRAMARKKRSINGNIFLFMDADLYLLLPPPRSTLGKGSADLCCPCKRATRATRRAWNCEPALGFRV